MKFATAALGAVVLAATSVAAPVAAQEWPNRTITLIVPFAPGGTPDDVVNKLNATLQEIIADPAILKSWADTGVSPYPKDQRTVAAARALLKSEIARWGVPIKASGMKIQ